MALGRRAITGIILIPLTAMACVFLDMTSKNWAKLNLSAGDSQVLFPGLLNLSITTNTGAAFSIGADHGSIMTTLATVLTMAIFSWSIKRQFEIPAPHVLESIGLGCITGGAIGNLIDRYTQGKVTDFLDFAFINFPVFNVADVLIDTGIALVIIAILITGKQVNVKKKTQEEQMPQATSNDVKTG